MTTTTPTVIVIDDDAGDQGGARQPYSLGRLSIEAAGFSRRIPQVGPAGKHLPAWFSMFACLDRAALIFNANSRRQHIRLPTIFITGHGDILMSVRAMKGGAIEFLTKPFREQDLLDAIQLGLERDRAWLDEEKADVGTACAV